MPMDENAFNELERKTSLLFSKPTPTPSPPLPQQTIFPTNFHDFFLDYIFYKTPPTPTFTLNTLTLTYPSRKSIQISTDAVFELLIDKYECRLPEIKDQTLPDFNEIDTFINNKISDIKSSFNRIISYNDVRVRQASEYYFKLMSYPLTLKIAFLEWEKSLNSIKIQNGIKVGLEKSDEAVRTAQQDYQKKIERERIDFQTRITAYDNEINRLRIISEHLKNSNDNLKTNADQFQEELTRVRQKSSDFERRIGEQELKLSELRTKNARLEQELKKYTSDEWTLVAGSTKDHPSFMNTKADEIINLPSLDDFFENYRITEKKDGLVTRESETDKIIIPFTLESQLQTLIEPLLSDPKTQKPIKLPKTLPSTSKSLSSANPLEDKLSVNDKRVLSVIKANKDGIERQEIIDVTGIVSNNMSSHTTKLTDYGMIELRDVINESGKTVKKYFVV